ncbi:unnamed protein product (macronuclear) [Paramecium tetraurelia]|uniref:Uncharacterized protein n=1 Tax=Paramecium tetraurelia TaxID=5888 RepID=A0DKH5_PARTE|nr:uncharacterized protein GSPATT00017872001 [Paramecium tetraurelia]CAK83542.1 unnamed protein product [Paramecium tetraurelia]|eukprot:XP_001450939.1 hypothetical protein (macronuclear) [Paramecium tetraurelia strain d4-2]
MAAFSTFNLITFGGFVIFSVVGINISNKYVYGDSYYSQLYIEILKVLLVTAGVMFIHQLYLLKRSTPSVVNKPNQKQINFNAFKGNIRNDLIQSNYFRGRI